MNKKKLMSEIANVLIRPIKAVDRPDWDRLWTGYLDFYETKLAKPVYDTAFARLLADGSQEFNGFVAEIEGQIVGLVHFLFHRHLWKVEDVCYLQDLYADPAIRGKGVGGALIDAVYRAADAKGAPAVYWMTQENNYKGRMLYDQIGQKTPFIKYSRP